MFRFEKLIHSISGKFNWIAASAIVLMMLLTCVDVVMRIFRHPVPGTYELIGLLGSVVISFSLAYTSIEKGHIAVEFLVQRLSPRKQAFTGLVNNTLSVLLFGLICWQSIIYAAELMAKGEVSLTIQFPIYPFVFGIAIGCGIQTLVLFIETVKSIQGVMKK